MCVRLALGAGAAPARSGRCWSRAWCWRSPPAWPASVVAWVGSAGAAALCAGHARRRLRRDARLARGRLHGGGVGADRPGVRHRAGAAGVARQSQRRPARRRRAAPPAAAARTAPATLLVVVEVALAMVLLVGAVLLLQTFVRLLNVDAGFRPDGVLTMEVALPRTAYPAARAADFFDRVTTRLGRSARRRRRGGDVGPAAERHREPASDHRRRPAASGCPARRSSPTTASSPRRIPGDGHSATLPGETLPRDVVGRQRHRWC